MGCEGTRACVVRIICQCGEVRPERWVGGTCDGDRGVHWRVRKREWEIEGWTGEREREIKRLWDRKQYRRPLRPSLT